MQSADSSMPDEIGGQKRVHSYSRPPPTTFSYESSNACTHVRSFVTIRLSALSSRQARVLVPSPAGFDPHYGVAGQPGGHCSWLL